MNASLPALPIPAKGIDTATLSLGEGKLNQDVAPTGDHFGPLLEQAVGALGEPPAAPPEGQEALLQQEQLLPPEGKLLPLLQQVLDAAADEGLDPDAVLKGIREKLEAVTADMDVDPDQAVAIAINQFIEENPKLAASIDTGMLRTLAGYSARTALEHPGSHVKNAASELLSGSTSAHSTDEAELPETAPHPAPRSAGGQARPGGEFMPPDLTRSGENSKHEAAALFSRLVAEAGSASGMHEVLPRGESLSGVLSALAPAPQAALAAQSSPALHNITLNVPFNQAGWDKALGERLQWMVGQGIQQANIKLNPAHLGPMEIRIQVQNDQASVHFTSAHTVVRDALEASLPRLREMFDNAGVELADVDVSGHSFSGQQAAADGQRGEKGSGGNSVFGTEGDAETGLEPRLYSLPASGRIDLFA